MKPLKTPPTTPAARAAKRLRQAERREAAYAAGENSGYVTLGRKENLARIKRLKAGTWPAPSVLVVQPEQLDGAITKAVLGVPLSAAEVGG